MKKIGVLGGGSLGTALVKTILDTGNDELYWWVREKKVREGVLKNNRNPFYLRAVDLRMKEENISNDINQIINNSELIFICIPSLFVRESFQNTNSDMFENKLLISTTKGLISHGHQTVSEYFRKTYNISSDQFVFLGGPAHAEEIVRKKSTFLTWASKKQADIEMVNSIFEDSFIQMRFSCDLVGLEYSSVLKNIYALAAGMSHGLGYGDNFISVFMSNAINELSYFLNQECPSERNINSSPYLGDLMVTAYSKFSRNRTFGELIGRGYSAKAALLELNMIPEGYYSLRSMHKIVEKKSLDMPIIRSLFKIVYEQHSAEKMVIELARGFV